MKQKILSALSWLVLGAVAFAQTPLNQLGTDSNQRINRPFKVGNGKSITIENGASLTAEVGASISIPAGSLTVPQGKTIYVDSVNGNDGTGQRGQSNKPFAKISAAMAVALSGDVVLVGPGTFTVDTTGDLISVPAGVSLAGAGRDRTLITAGELSSGGVQTLIALGHGAGVRDLSVSCTVEPKDLTTQVNGIATSGTARIERVRLTGVSAGVALQSAAVATIQALEATTYASCLSTTSTSAATVTDCQLTQILQSNSAASPFAAVLHGSSGTLTIEHSRLIAPGVQDDGDSTFSGNAAFSATAVKATAGTVRLRFVSTYRSQDNTPALIQNDGATITTAGVIGQTTGTPLDGDNDGVTVEAFNSLALASPLPLSQGGTGSTDNVAARQALGMQGAMYVGAFMRGISDERMVVGISTNGMDWTLLNNGDPVYAAAGYVPGQPEHCYRDGSLLYQASTGTFYVTHTAGTTGFSGYLSIVKSKDLINWTHVADIAGPSGVSGTLWGPDIVEDPDTGDIYLFCACATATMDPGGLRIYRTKFTTPTNLAGGVGTWTAVTVPAGDTSDALNEVNVFRTASGAWRMLIFSFTDNCYKCYGSSSVTGTWTSIAANMGMAQREGIFALEKPDGSWRVYSAYQPGANAREKRYNWNDWNSSFSAGTGLVPVELQPDGIVLENGRAILVQNSVMASLAPWSVMQGTMSRQNSDAVTITGGTITGVAGVRTAAGSSVRVPIHQSWTAGGLEMENANGTVGSILGEGADNVLYLALPNGGGGLSVYNGARSVQAMGLTNAGALTLASTGTFGGTVTTSGNVAAVTGQVRVGGDSGWTTGGVRFYSNSSTPSAFLGCFSSGQFGMRLGTDGNGCAIYDGAGSTLAATITNAGGLKVSSVQIGLSNGAGGNVVEGIYSASDTLNFPSIAATGGTQDLTITVAGAAVGDSVALGLPSAPSAGVVFNAWVSATNTVTVRATNCTASPIDPASATYRATVTQF